MFPIQDPILIFTVLMLVIFAAPLIADRLRIPDLVLLLGAGALIGPNGVGMMDRSSAITLFGSIGLLYIMFIAGLEIDLNRFMRTRNRSIVFGLLTFSIPQFFGTILGHYVLGFNWTASILLASMFASHTLLAYPIASRFGISRSEPVVITVGGTIITDTLALLVLAVIADSAKGVSLGFEFWTTMALGMAGLVFIIAYGVPRLTGWFFKNVTERGGSQFLFVLGVVCGCAYLSHFAKMEPIIGAFLVGAVFNRLIPEQSALMNRLVFVGNTLFIPFFLISVGMLVNVHSMVASRQGWLVVGSMVVCVIVTKYAAAWVTRVIFKYSVEAGRVIFGLSVVQAAATLAAVVVGYDLKIFDENVLNGAIMMILVSCPLGAWAVDRYGRSLIGKEQIRQEQVATEQRLLVSIANPEYSLRLLNLSFLLRDRSRRGNIYPVTIVSDIDNTDEAVARGEKLLAGCLAEGASADIEVTPSVRVELNPSDGLVRAARDLRATQVLAGWSRRQLLEYRVFGTISGNLLDTCPQRLLFCHLASPLNTTKRVLMPFPQLGERRTDLKAFLHDAKRLTRQIGANLRVYLVDNGNSTLRQLVETARPSCPLNIVAVDTWSKLQSLLLEDIAADDMVILPCERRDGIFWTPALDRLQEQIFTRFPQNNLLSAYPSSLENTGEEEEKPKDKHTLPPMYPVDIVTDMGCEAALLMMVQKVFHEEPEIAADINELLTKSMNSYPLELSNQIVLLHAHCESIDAPVMIVGRGNSNWHFRNLKGEYHIMIALISPKSAPPEQHLNALAALARRFLAPDTADKARAAISAEDICQLFD